jgi:hypothetical protein
MGDQRGLTPLRRATFPVRGPFFWTGLNQPKFPDPRCGIRRVHSLGRASMVRLIHQLFLLTCIAFVAGLAFAGVVFLE